MNTKGRRLGRNAALFILFLMMAITAKAESPTSPTMRLMIQAQSLTGMPVSGVKFQIQPIAGEPVIAETKASGVASTEIIESPPSNIDITIADDSYGVASVMSAAGKRTDLLIFFYEVYPTDPKRMTREEREAFVLEYPAVLAFKRNAGADLPGSATDPHPLRMSALLNVRRPEGIPWGTRALSEEDKVMESGDGKGDEDSPTIVIKLVDSFGQPATQQVVELFGIVGGTADVELVRRGRTDSNGEIYFRDLDPDRYYRARCPADGGREMALSRVLLLSEDQSTRNETMVLRRVNTAISGIVYHGEKPLPLAQVEVSRADGFQLTDTTDELGYFSIAPVPPGNLTLTVTNVSNGDKASFPVKPSNEELLIPFDIMTMPVKEMPEEPAVEGKVGS